MQARTKIRKRVHGRREGVVNLGRSTAFCGRIIHDTPDRVPEGRPIPYVRTFGALDITVHGTLVTCHACLKNMRTPD